MDIVIIATAASTGQTVGFNLTGQTPQAAPAPSASAGFSLSSQPTLNLGSLTTKTTQPATQPTTTPSTGIQLSEA